MTGLPPEYLGDGVYASSDGYHIWLAANHHENKVVALEPCVVDALILYIERFREWERQIIEANKGATPGMFSEGDCVRYIPMHAHGDPEHEDCENGVVTSTNDKFVFVRYGDKVSSQATDPRDLSLIARAVLRQEAGHE